MLCCGVAYWSSAYTPSPSVQTFTYDNIIGARARNEVSRHRGVFEWVTFSYVHERVVTLASALRQLIDTHNLVSMM